MMKCKDTDADEWMCCVSEARHHSWWHWSVIPLQNTHTEFTLKSLFITFLTGADTYFPPLYSTPPSLTTLLLTFGSADWKRSPLSPVPFPWAVFSWGLILHPPLKPFVACWKLADAETIRPKLLDQYKHQSLHPEPFWASQWPVH